VGSICTRDDECAGICLLVAGDVTFPDGYCVAPTVRPPAEDFVANAPLPTHGCPANTVILPLAGDAPGDYTYCWQQCHDDADCRTGYRCDHQGASSARFSDGACRPTR
jgi:hypothetical protein